MAGTDAAAREQEAVLAIDLGTGGPKVAVVSSDGEVMSTGFAATSVLLTADGGAEQDPAEWWEATLAAARDALGALPAGAPRPVAVAVTAQWMSTVPVRADGQPVGNAIIWRDTRGARYVRAVAGGRVRVAGYDPSKAARWVYRTGGAPSLDGRDPVGQILFLRNERPEAYERADYVVEPGDYLVARLTGRVATAPETAVATWATDNRDVDAIDYDRRLLALTGLDGERLAPIVPSGSTVGTVLPDVAAALGIDTLPVIASTPDLMSAAAGSGAVADGAPHLYVGTSAWLSAHVPFRRVDPLHQIATLPSSLPGRYLIACEQQSAGAALDHLRERLLVADPQEAPSYEELLAEAASAPLGAGGVQFTPWLNGERTPLDDATIRGAYSNISLRTTRADLVRATLEGVAMNAALMLRAAERLVRRPLGPIAFIGGGARSDLFCQIVADVLDREIDRTADAQHANVRGAALLALAGLGRISVDEIGARVRIDRRFAPVPDAHARYRELSGDFRRHYRVTRRWHARRNGPGRGRGRGGHAPGR